NRRLVARRAKRQVGRALRPSAPGECEAIGLDDYEAALEGIREGRICGEGHVLGRQRESEPALLVGDSADGDGFALAGDEVVKDLRADDRFAVRVEDSAADLERVFIRLRFRVRAILREFRGGRLRIISG